MLRESLFKCPFSLANVAFANDIVACSDLFFVYDVVGKAMVVQWAFVLVLAVTCLFLGHSGVYGSDLFVVLVNNGFHVFHAAVAYFTLFFFNLWCLGKCFCIKFRKVLPMFV